MFIVIHPLLRKQSPMNPYFRTPSVPRQSLLSRLVVITKLGFCVAAQAQSAAPAQPAKGDWELRGGLTLVSTPSYPGAKKNRTLPLPSFSAIYKDTFFIDFDEGLGVQMQPAAGLMLKAALGYSTDTRRAKDDVRFQGLKDIKATGALNLKLDYKLGDAFLAGAVRSRLGNSDSRGTTMDTDLGYNLIAGGAMRVDLGVHAKAMDKSYAKTFFSISEAQSAASGLAVFKADGGLQSAGVFAQVVYGVSQDWTVFGRAELLRLRGDATNSPVTVQKRQTTFIVNASRSF
jgi:MipA family protein